MPFLESIKLYFGLLLLAFATRAIAVTNEELDYGLKIWKRAYEAVSWYEGGMRFPFVHNSQVYLYYHYLVQHLKVIEESLKPHPPKAKMHWYGHQWFTDEDGPLAMFPEEYKKECFALAKDPLAKPTVNESKALDDGGKEYPFKAFSYCLLNQIRKRGGDKIVEAWKNERLNGKKDWREVMLARDNAFRDRHGSEPFTMTDELNEGAQQWADQMSKECKMYHSPPDILFKDMSNPLGENIASATMIDDFSMMGLIATNTWYEEIKFYCYPDEFLSQVDSKPPGCQLGGPKQTGHFTALVWKETRKVGYGTACNSKCPSQGMCYTVARYSQIGNHVGLPDAFKNNVQRPKY